MPNHLDQTLKAIENAYSGRIKGNSRFYVEVDIGAQAEEMGFSDVANHYRKVLAVVPIREAEHGMKVRIDGRTFVNYGQLESGVAIPGRAVKQSRRSYTTYIPNDSMILNFV